MEEILENLKKSYSERNPQETKKFKFYSNLSVTQPLQKQSELTLRVRHGMEYLSNRVVKNQIGLQSVQLSRKSSGTEFEIIENSIFPPENYTTLLAIDLLGDEDNNLQFPVKSMIDFVIPESGISTFGIFKQSLELAKSRPPSSSGCSSGEFDVEINYLGINSDKVDWEEETMECNNLENSILAHDCNTTSLGLSILLQEGILDIKPASSVTELILSNVGDFSSKDLNPGVIRAFLNGDEIIDAVSCANILFLYYTLTEELEEDDASRMVTLNYEENVESTELFLVETLNNLLTGRDDQDSSFFEVHHSPDALLYFLSRCTTISKQARNRFAEPLTNLLDKRIGNGNEGNDGPLNLAMRILSADELCLLSSSDGNWMKRKLEAEVCKLAEMQDKTDGSWPIDSLFKINMKMVDNNNKEDEEVHFGGRDVSTLFACKALHVYNQNEKDAKFYTKCCREVLY